MQSDGLELGLGEWQLQDGWVFDSARRLVQLPESVVLVWHKVSELTGASRMMRSWSVGEELDGIAVGWFALMNQGE
jgi:hypothetical protein